MPRPTIAPGPGARISPQSFFVPARVPDVGTFTPPATYGGNPPSARPALLAAIMAGTVFAPAPAPEQPRAQGRAVYPDRVEPSRGLPAYEQRFLSFDPKSEQPRAQGRAVYPDVTLWRTLLVADQQHVVFVALVSTMTFADAYFALPLQRVVPAHAAFTTSFSERTSPLASTTYPDRIDLTRGITTCEQEFVFYLRQEQPLPEPSTTYPNRLIPASGLPAYGQRFFSFDPKPERSLAFSQSLTPDWLSPPRGIATCEQQSFALDPKPERMTATALAVYPDVFFSPLRGQSGASFDPKLERTITLASAVYLDRLESPRGLVASEQPFTTAISPQPEQSLLELSTTYSVGVRPPQQASIALGPAPERTAPTAVATYPDRVEMPRGQPSQEQQFTAGVRPEIPVPQPSVAYPDRIVATPGLSAHGQRAQWFDPAPERPLAFAAATYPDWASPPRGIGVYTQRAFDFAPQPERTAPIAAVTFPDRISPAPGLPACEQPFTTSISAQPERVLSTESVVYPDGFPRQFPQFTPTASDSKPERTAAFASSIYSDRIEPPCGLPTYEQHATTGARPEQPTSEPSVTTSVTSHPPRGLWACEQQAFAFLSQPEPLATPANAIYPDALTVKVTPPGMTTTLALEAPTPFAAAVYPDFTSYVAQPPNDGSSFAFDLLPIPTPTPPTPFRPPTIVDNGGWSWSPEPLGLEEVAEAEATNREARELEALIDDGAFVRGYEVEVHATAREGVVVAVAHEHVPVVRWRVK